MFVRNGRRMYLPVGMLDDGTVLIVRTSISEAGDMSAAWEAGVFDLKEAEAKGTRMRTSTGDLLVMGEGVKPLLVTTDEGQILELLLRVRRFEAEMADVYLLVMMLASQSSVRLSEAGGPEYRPRTPAGASLN